MNQKTNVIKKNDFEKYEVMLPFTAVAGKRRKNYLCQELEKMHPCFSDEFGFDAVIRKVCKKGIKTDVLVMSKSKLAEYEGQRRFSGSGFLLDDSSEGKLHRFFMSAKCKGTLCGLVICGLLGICGFGAGFFNSKLMNKNDVERPGAESLTLVEESEGIDEAAPFENLPYLSDLFFESVGKSKGKIGFFEWESDGFVEKLNASVTGVYPENFYDIKVGSVTYEDGLPLISVSHTARLPPSKNYAGGGGKTGGAAAGSSREFPQKVRSAISSSGGKLCEESVEPYHIEFECDSTEEAAQCLQKIDSLLFDSEGRVTAAAVRRTGKNNFQIELSISEDFPAVFDLKLLADNLYLFNQKASVKSKAVLNVVPKSENQKSDNLLLSKVGEIKRPDKSVIVYYKNRDGKLEKVIKAPEVK